MLVIAVGILGFVGIVLLAALLMVGIEAGSEVVRDLKRDPGLKIALWGIAAAAGPYGLGRPARVGYWLLGSWLPGGVRGDVVATLKGNFREGAGGKRAGTGLAGGAGGG